MTIWFENVAKKNGVVIQINYFVHYCGGDGRDFVIMSEYKSLSDVVTADSVNTALWRQFMPDAKRRTEFNQKLGRYFETGYSDEIYRILPKFMK